MIKFLKLDLRSAVKFIFIGIIWGVVPVITQFRSYTSWQEYLRNGNPYLLFFAGFSGAFLMSLYKSCIDSKKTQK